MTKNSEHKESPKGTETTPLSPQVSKTPDRDTKQKKWRIDRLFWGLLLILVGVLSLADNFGFLGVQWTNVWRLWPVAIIAAGLSVLSIQNRFWKILSVLLVIATLIGVAVVATVDYSDKATSGNYKATVNQSSNEIKQAEVLVQAGASVLRVDTAKQTAIAAVTLQSDLATLAHTSVADGTTQRLSFSMNGSNRWWVGDVRSTWDVLLTRNLPLQVRVDAGASDTTIDLSQAQLQSLTVKAGASSLDLKVGNRQDMTAVAIDSGVSSVVLRVPNGSGVRLVLDGGLTTKRLADLADTGNDTYESPGYSQATKKIAVTAKIGVATFSVERY